MHIKSIAITADTTNRGGARGKNRANKEEKGGEPKKKKTRREKTELYWLTDREMNATEYPMTKAN